MTCERCNEFPGASFCPYCGDRLDGNVPPKKSTDVLLLITSLTMVLSIILLATELVSMWSGIGITFDWLEEQKKGIMLLLPTIVVVTSLSGLSLQCYWLALVGAITASAVLLLIRSKKAFIIDSYKDGGVAHTPLFWTTICFAASVIITLGLNAIMTLMGSGITTPGDLPSGNNPEAMFLFAEAAVWEEVVSRVMYIGLPMLVAALLLKKEKCWRYLLGGFEMSRLAVVLIMISALVFAFAHMDSWGFSKVIPVFLGGVLFGYLFVRFGVYAGIIMHFLTDYLVVASTTAPILSSVIMLGLMVLGFVSLMYILYRLYLNRNFWNEIPNIFPDDE